MVNALTSTVVVLLLCLGIAAWGQGTSVVPIDGLWTGELGGVTTSFQVSADGGLLSDLRMTGLFPSTPSMVFRIAGPDGSPLALRIAGGGFGGGNGVSTSLTGRFITPTTATGVLRFGGLGTAWRAELQSADLDLLPATGSEWITARSGRFSFRLPPAWRLIADDDSPSTGNSTTRCTDALTFSWDGATGHGADRAMLLLRFAAQTPISALVAEAICEAFVDCEGLLGWEWKRARIGSHSVQMVGGPVGGGKYVCMAYIAQGRLLYAGLIAGPIEAVRPQWTNFQMLLGSLSSPDLTPEPGGGIYDR